MYKYYLRIKWMDREFEVSEDEYRRIYQLHGASGTPTSAVPDQFKTDAIYGRIDKSGRGEKAGIFQDSMLD